MNKITGILILLIYVCLATMLLRSEFVGAGNMKNLTKWSALFGVLGIGVAFVIITGGIDLSIGSVIGLVGCLVPMFVLASERHEPRATVATSSFLFGAELLVCGGGWLLWRWKSRSGPRSLSLRPPLALAGGGIGLCILGAIAAATNPPGWLAIACALAGALAVSIHLGMIHGLLITKAKLQPFVVTLCGLLIYRGIARWITGDQNQGLLNRYDDSLRLLATANPCSMAQLVFVAGLMAAGYCVFRLAAHRKSSTLAARQGALFGLISGVILAVVAGSRLGSGVEFDLAGWHVDLNPEQVPGVLLRGIGWLSIPVLAWLLITAARVAGRALAAPLAALVVTALVLEGALWFADSSPSTTGLSGLWFFRLRIAAVFGALAAFMGAVAWFGNTALKHGRAHTQLPLLYAAATALAWLVGHKFGPLSLADTLLGQMLVPAPFFVMVALAVVAAIFLNHTIYGRYLLALGRNEQAARFSGIQTDGLVIAAYVICAGVAGLGGILFQLEQNSIQPSGHGNFYELYAIAAAVLGGCSLRGGEGSILGVVIGATVVRVLYNSINILGIPSQLEFAIIGTVILVGVLTDETIKRVSARRRALAAAKARAVGSEGGSRQ